MFRENIPSEIFVAKFSYGMVRELPYMYIKKTNAVKTFFEKKSNR